MIIRAITREDYPVLGRMMTDFEAYLQTLEPKAKKPRSMNRAKRLQRMDFLAHGGAGLIAEEKGKPLGYLTYFPSASFGSMERTFYMPDLYVDARHRGRGVGQKLMAALMKEARVRKVTSILWTVYDMNPKALSFYVKLGGHIIRDEFVMAVEVPKALRQTKSHAKLGTARV